MSLVIPMLLDFAAIAGLLFYIAWARRRGRRSRSWPTVSATVTAARVVIGGKNWVPRIDYAYVFEGRAYTSHRRSLGITISRDRGTAESIVAACPVGSTVVASVDPNDPAYAVLVPGIGGGHLLMIGVLTLIVVPPTVFLFTLVFGGNG